MNFLSNSQVHNMKRVLLSSFVAACGLVVAHAALTKDFYTSSSVLNSGNWVKIGVDKTGVYEISYESLRAMGFSSPEKVSLFGRGGRALPESFVSNAGIPILTDDLSAVKVLHEDGKLYFYGLGPEEINFNASPDYETGGYFSRAGNNVYSKRGYYFLTDSRPVTAMKETNYDVSSAPRLEKGVSYVYHELDSVQNTTMSGQLFWGEHLSYPGGPRRRWDVVMPGATGDSGVMECVAYFQPPGLGYGSGARVNYGFEGEGLKVSSNPFKENTTLYYAPHNPTVDAVDIPGTSGSVFLELSNAIDMSEYSNLDYWVVSYPSSVPSLQDVDGVQVCQQLIAFPDIAKNTTGKLVLSNPSSFVVLDVTSAAEPQRLKVNSQYGEGTAGVKNSSNKAPVVVVFDKNKPQLQISGFKSQYSRIENQNLHAYKEKGADFIIVTTNKFKPYAEELAELHRTRDNIEVVVATVEELYNEFSGGTPDPMAYRSFAKMLYMNDGRKPKNMLLFGPIYSDVRGLQSEHDPTESIIAYQSPAISISRGAHNINDFYGMMDDKFRTDYYERNNVQIGVGILPVKFESDARIVVDKIRNYLDFTDHAYFLNRFTGVGGLGDQHTHEIQVRDISNHMRQLDNHGMVFTPLSIDTYGKTEARKKFMNQIYDGCTMLSYFGHGAEQFLGLDKEFFNAGDVFALRNRYLPFALFGGCQITNSDRGFRGLGESIVTSTPYGCIGSIVSGRDTWSGQNYEFFKQFFTCLYTKGSLVNSERRSEPVTIGEVYAAVKHYSTYNNELSYQLLCDPALIIPSINRSVDLEFKGALKPGDPLEISGRILKNDQQSIDAEFNGQVVVRLNEPEKSIPVGKIETGEDPKELAYVYRDAQVSMMAAEVKDGTFSIKVHVPATMSAFQGQNALLYVAAYDPSSKVGAAKGFPVEVGVADSSSSEAGDLVPPVVEALAFDNADCSLSLAVSDNVALNMSSNPLSKGLYLYIDGRERNEAHFVEPVMVANSAAYSKIVPLDGLAYGDHTARIKVKDAAGNSSEHEILFTYSPQKAKYIISRDDNSSPSSSVIKIDGDRVSEAVLVVLSSKGEEVWRGEFDGNRVEWNHEYADGSKVPAGHYKAYLLETGGNAVKGHSETIDIPVI